MTSDLEERLRNLLASWYYVPPDELFALGPPALERLLDATEGRPLVREGDDWRDYEDALHAALGAWAERDLDGVLAAMRRRGWDAVRIALSGPGQVSDPRVLPMLLEAYASKEPLRRQYAVNLLARQEDPRATEALIRALSDRSSDVKSAAIEALAAKGDPAAVPALQEFARRHARSPLLAEDARAAVKRIRKSARHP